MKPRIGIDLDEVLTHFLSAFLEFQNKTYNTDYTTHDFDTYNYWEVFQEPKETTIQKVYAFHKTKYFQDMAPIQDAQSALQKLSSKYDLYLITARQKEVQTPTEQWIQQHFPDIFTKILCLNHFSQNQDHILHKYEVCLQYGIHIMIEDSAEYAQECANHQILTYLFEKPWNQKNRSPRNKKQEPRRHIGKTVGAR